MFDPRYVCLFADPEHQHAIQTSYVHDMVVMPWQQSEQETYIAARQAWYVLGHNKKGLWGQR